MIKMNIFSVRIESLFESIAYLPKRSLQPPMKQSTRMLGMVAEMVVIWIQAFVSLLMWFTASLASLVSIVKMMLQLLVGRVREFRSLR